MREGIGLSAGELQRRALRAVGWSSLSSTLSLPLAIAVSVVLARTLGPHEYARFAYLAFLVPLLYQSTDFGYAMSVTRLASQRFAAGDLEGTRELLGKSVGWNLLRLPLVAVVVLAAVRPGPLLGMLLVAYLALAMAGGGLVFSLQAENRGATLAALAFGQGLAAAAASVAAALMGASGTAVWVASFASALAVLPAWPLLANRELRRAAVRPRLPRGMPVGFWRYGLGTLAASLGTLLVFSRSEVVILNAFDEHQALAVFALAFGLAQRMTTPVDTVLGPLTPALAALEAAHPERLRAGFERSVRLSAAAVTVLAGTALVGTVFAAPLLFGPEYHGVGAAFAALAVVTLLQAAAQPYTALAYAAGRPGVVVRALTVALAFDVAVALVLIPSLGLWGAVAANAVGGLVAIVLVARSAAGPRSIRRARVPALRMCAIAAVACGGAYVAGAAAGALHPVLGAAAAFAAGIALTLTFVRGVVPRGDAEAVLDVLAGRLPRVQRLARLLVSPAH